MKRRLIAVLLGSAALAAFVAVPSTAGALPNDRAVFVQTNNPSGNQVAVYDRAANGALSFDRRYDTGGLGGSIGGAVVDKLASQGSLTYDSSHHVLLAVNAGSGTVTAFRVDNERLSERDVVSLGQGSIPVSVAIHDNLVYVLDASGKGSVHGFRLAGHHLIHLPWSERGLGLDPTLTPPFLNTPGQVGFTPDGRHLVVTTKNNGSNIDVFDVLPSGWLSFSPARTTSATPVPFGFTFDGNRLVVGEAGTSSLSTYNLGAHDRYNVIGSAADGQQALCWIAQAKGYFYVANAGSANISEYRVDASGHPFLVGIAATTDPGTIDLATTPDGNFLYAEAGANGVVDAFRVQPDGSLQAAGSVGGLGATQIEGIATN